jgi:hypothetical protein
MAEIQKMEGLTESPKHDAPEQSKVEKGDGVKAGHGIDQEGPAPPTSMPPGIIQEESFSDLIQPI